MWLEGGRPNDMQRDVNKSSLLDDRSSQLCSYFNSLRRLQIYTKNLITRISQADAAVFMVSAVPGEFEAGISKEGKTTSFYYGYKTIDRLYQQNR